MDLIMEKYKDWTRDDLIKNTRQKEAKMKTMFASVCEELKTNLVLLEKVISLVKTEEWDRIKEKCKDWTKEDFLEYFKKRESSLQ